MSLPALIHRLEILEGKVEALEFLPSRIDALTLQIVQFREDVRAEISATRSELRDEIRRGNEESRRYARILHDELSSKMAAVQEALPPEP